MLRRDVQRSLQEAEQLALKTLEQVIKQPTLQLPPRGGFLREKKDREWSTYEKDFPTEKKWGSLGSRHMTYVCIYIYYVYNL